MWFILCASRLQVLFRVVLALLRINETAICSAKSMEEAIETLQNAASRCFDCDQLIKVRS